MEITRNRLTVEEPWEGVSSQIYNGQNLGSSYNRGTIMGKQTTVSEGHPVSRLGDYDSRTGRYEDVGGNFTTSKEEYDPGNSRGWSLYRKKGLYQYYYGGPILANSTSGSSLFSPGKWFSSQGPSTVSVLDGLGTTAIARTIPTNPVADSATFIGELREGLPSLVGAQVLKRPRPGSTGSEYLNWQFGIMPLIGDFQKFAKAYKTSDKVLKQLRRDSGRIVRRRYSFPDVRILLEDSEAGNSYPHPALDSNLYAGGGVRRIHTELRRKTWFSGAYTYYLPKEDDLFGRYSAWLAQANKLLGIRLTPETFWDLTPWSWAVDWFSNTGDVFHNLGAFANDGLLLRWGYIMEETTIVSSYSWSGVVYIDNQPTTISTNEVFTKTWKVRRKATPFGFGLNFSGFTPRQLAIIAALGISRGQK